MKIILLSDCHLSSSNPIGRLDDVLETSLRKMEFILNYAKEKKIKIVLQAGDFLDTSRSWILHSSLVDIFNEYKESKIFTCYGQHDTYMNSEESKLSTSLGIFIKSGYLNLLGEKPYSIEEENINIYGCSWGQKIPVPQKSNGQNILVIHESITFSPLFKGHQYLDAKDFLRKEKDYHLILCGDIHRQFFFGSKDRMILNLGPLLRLDVSRYSLEHKPCFAVLDTDKWDVSFVNVPHEPAEEIMSRKHIEDREKTSGKLDEFIQTIKASEFQGVDFLKNLENFMEEKKIREAVKKEIRLMISSE